MKKQYVIIAFILVVAGLALVASYVRGGDEPPEMLAFRALRRFAAAENVSADINVSTFIASSSLTFDESNQPKIDAALVPVSASGKMRLRRRPDAPLQADARLVVTVGQMLGRSEIGADIIADGSEAFLKLSGMPAETEAGVSIKALDDRWMSFDRETAAAIVLRKKLAAVSDRESAPVPSAGFSRLLSHFTSGDLFALDRQMVSEFVGGRPTRHFAVVFNKEKVGVLIADLFAAVEGREAAPEEAAAAAARVGADYALNGEIWVDKKTAELRKFGFEVQPVSAENAAIPLRVVVEFDDYGSPVVIEAPAGATPFADIVKNELLR